MEELFKNWLENLDDSFKTKLDDKILTLLNIAFLDGYEKGHEKRARLGYEEWNQK